ncbi:MAG: DNA-processing protein DprA [Bdellovibrionota bacterium]
MYRCSPSSWFNCIYPRENQRLKQSILAQGGTLCSEYALGVRPRQHHFRDRNRINAALSDGILVVEADQKSGTKITVHEGLLLNKEIYSIPGPIDSSMSVFPNQLIADGAKVVQSAKDIVEDFKSDFIVSASKACIEHISDRLDRDLLRYFDVDEAKSIDGFEHSKHCLPEIIERVSQFEIDDVLKQGIDGRYVLTKRYE